MKKLIYIMLISCFAMFSSKGQNIVINEYSAANYDTYLDNYNESEDWVELYNRTAAPIDLNGWALSDKVSNPLKWVFPSTFIIQANSVVLIYCSGRDELTAAGAHTNFKITQTKGIEVLMLSDAGGIFQDSIRVLPNQKSHTRGRETNGSAIWSVFTTGTPNASNIGAMQEYATTPVFSQSGGYSAGAVNLSLSSPSSNITIYYTTNGDEPNNTSALYTGPINIATTTIVKAIAYSSTANIPHSFIDFHTFFINDTHTIPILSVSGDSVDVLIEDGLDDIGPWWASTPHEPQGTIEWYDKNGVLIDKGTGEYNKHGNDSWLYDQRGFDYIMRDQFGYNHSIKDKLFATKDRDKFQRIILKAAANDNFSFEDGAHIRDSYVHHLSQLADLRMDERSYTSCIVYLNGEYWGVYDLREKADDHDFTNYYYDQPSGQVDYLKTWGGTWSELPYSDPAAPAVMANWNTIKNYITTNPMTVQASYNYVKGIFNTGSIIDYFLLNSYVVCSDWLNWNTAWWRGLNPNGDKRKWRYALWDMDATFDHYINYTNVPSTSPTADPCDPSSLGNPGNQGHVPIWNALLANQEFHDDYINRWQDLANGPLSCDFMIDLLDSMILVITPEMPRQIITWGGGTMADWQANVQDLKDFILARCDSMNAGFVNCDTAITGPYDVTVEIIGIGEVEMSNGNLINDLNTPWTDQRFGGILLPFEVKSGSFNHWEVYPINTYIYDSFADTLALDLQGDVTVKAYFTPTREIVYVVDPIGTSTTITVNGAVINTFPTTINYTLNDTVQISPNNIDPLYGFSSWSSDSVNLMPLSTNITDSFYVSNNDTIKLHLKLLPTISAFISGNDTICDNANVDAEVKIYFSEDATPPFTIDYAINGVSQPSDFTSTNPYVIYTKQAGIYTLTSFADANEIGSISGEALVTRLAGPAANFEPQPDSMTILYTTTQLVDKSEGNIINWQWDFGDNTPLNFSKNPYHTYNSAVGVYQITMIISDANGCSDTTFKHVQIANDHWMYIPKSFTPDLDGKNDKFCISYHGVREETFIFNLYSRFSELVYSTNNINDLKCIYIDGNAGDLVNGWDGKHQVTGNDLPIGAYIYEIYFQDFEGGRYQENSEIILLR